MAICRIYEVEGATLEQYDEVDAKFPENPAGATLHVAGSADGTLYVVEIWETAQHADDYMATGIAEAIEAAGIGEPSVTEFEVHNFTHVS